MKAIYVSGLLLLLQAVFSPCQAQSETGADRPASTLEQYRPPSFGIHIMPLSFAMINSRLRVGAQWNRDQWSYGLDLEYGNRWVRSLFNWDDGFRFYGIRPEVRYAIARNRRKAHFLFGGYIALEIPFTYYEKDLERRTHFLSGSLVTFDSAIQRRTRISCLLKAGKSLKIGNAGYFEYYLGGGIARRSYRYTDLVNPRVVDDSNEIFPLSREGSKTVLDLTLGLRFGVLIR